MAWRACVAGVAIVALGVAASRLAAQEAGTPTSGPRLRCVRANDGTSIGSAEVFDLVLDLEDRTKTFRSIRDPDAEMPKLARRIVADRDGWVELAPGRIHTLLARAPGRYRYLELVDVERQCRGKLELLTDDPLVLELVDARGAPVEGAIVEYGQMRECGNEVHPNQPWRATSDRSGRVLFPHYLSWRVDDRAPLGDWLELQTPVKDPPRFALRQHGGLPKLSLLDETPRVVTWQLPPLSKLRVEFPGADALPPEQAITFEMVGPRQLFGEPDRYASDHGGPVDLLTETGVELRACFHWRRRERGDSREPDLRVFGSAHPIEGGSALLRVPVASDPVVVRLRPVRGAGATFPGSATAGAKVRNFDVSLQWFDCAGFRLCANVCGVAPDDTGALRFPWPRPRFDAAERPAKLRVALRKETHLYGWEPLEPDDLIVREVDWPLGDSLDVGTLVVPGSG